MLRRRYNRYIYIIRFYKNQKHGLPRGSRRCVYLILCGLSAMFLPDRLRLSSSIVRLRCCWKNRIHVSGFPGFDMILLLFQSTLLNCVKDNRRRFCYFFLFSFLDSLAIVYYYITRVVTRGSTFRIVFSNKDKISSFVQYILFFSYDEKNYRNNKWV